MAGRKVKALLESEAAVTVVSPQLTTGLTDLKTQAQIKHIEREYQERDLAGMFLVISATNNEEANRQVAEHCFAKKILVNVVDDPPKCNFFVPAVVRRGLLTIAVSTDGKSPLLAARIRAQLETQYGDGYAELLELLGQVRQDLLENIPEPDRRREILERLVEPDVLLLFKEKRYDQIKEWVQSAYRSGGG
ncbi:MAG: bifunctional precorrin-2 dehydrogenase/sirohydrochlorin ferrochelatase [Desulfotomaculum sp.]|nr:bifunctional precorrin-2 dehydrogenase/sirohydrochlorin ferrochelatase [Desulfotomaculum sp.]